MKKTPEQEILQELVVKLKEYDLQGAILAASQVPRLFRELEDIVQRGIVSPKLVTKGYLQGLASNPPETPKWARSLIILSMFQPIGRFRFEHEHGALWGLIPPQYMENQDIPVERTLRDLLPPGTSIAKARIPLKLAALRAGLATYGRNNLTYTETYGSFHRLAAFYLDIPWKEGLLEEFKVMPLCASCSACIRNCPTGCIDRKRFVIRAEKCLTFYNESPEDLPAWIDPTWMNALVGCLRCQNICPANKKVLSKTETWGNFSKAETKALISASTPEQIPPFMKKIFDERGLTEYLPVIGRNLKVLLER